jgi:hypothetical protein
VDRVEVKFFYSLANPTSTLYLHTLQQLFMHMPEDIKLVLVPKIFKMFGEKTTKSCISNGSYCADTPCKSSI